MRHLLEEAFNRIDIKVIQESIHSPSQKLGLSELAGHHMKLRERHRAAADRADRAGNTSLARRHRESATEHDNVHSSINRILRKEVKGSDKHPGTEYRDDHDGKGYTTGSNSYEEKARSDSEVAIKTSERLGLELR